MNPIPGTYCDGETLRGIPVTLDFSDPGRLQAQGDGLAVNEPWENLAVSDRLAGIARFIYLPGRAIIETQANDEIDRALRAQRRGFVSGLIHALEARSAIAAGAVVLIALCAALAYAFGLPILSRHTAQRTPPEIEARIGQIALASLNEYFGRSELPAAQRQRVVTQLHRLLPDADEATRPRLVFRSLGAQAPNAFALPGGIIIVSDELVKLAGNDDEIAAVLAHEIGHLKLRHSIQSALRGSFALLVVSTLTGDLSSLTTFAGSIPWLILNQGYSREFEREADEYAHALMLKRGVRLKHFATILQKLETAAGGPGPNRRQTYFSTHPSTADRILLFQPHPDPLPPPPPAAKTPPFSELVKNLQQPSTAIPPVEATEAEVTLAFVPYSNRKPPASVVALRSVYDLPQFETPPALLHSTPVAYPGNMRRLKREGTALVDFVVDRGGDVRAAYVVEASNEAFAQAALTAIEQWKFRPAQIGGEPVNAHLQQPIHFTLAEAAPPSAP